MAILPLTALKVMIVGHGFMGVNHRKKVEALETEGIQYLKEHSLTIKAVDTV